MPAVICRLLTCIAVAGWSHFAQFTIAVVNKDPKKSKYSGAGTPPGGTWWQNAGPERASAWLLQMQDGWHAVLHHDYAVVCCADTLHRFCKKEHDWGWKKFMELNKVLEGFTVSNTLVIKAQVQVIRRVTQLPFPPAHPKRILDAGSAVSVTGRPHGAQRGKWRGACVPEEQASMCVERAREDQRGGAAAWLERVGAARHRGWPCVWAQLDSACSTEAVCAAAALAAGQTHASSSHGLVVR